MEIKPYSVNEMFFAFQGEGVHMGRAAYFIRFHGCDQRCNFCDSAGTWHPNYKPENVPRLTPLQIAQQVEKAGLPKGAFVVLTGGEPALYTLSPLIAMLRSIGFDVHIETAGHRPLPRSINWITLSPKLFGKPPLLENIERANEFKIIVDRQDAIDEALALILPYAREKAPIWLHPEWGQRNNPQILELISRRVKADTRLRAGYQIHKLYKCDALDPGASRVLIPLGGDPQRGPSQ
jgi:7-carboxy-7-deazaguanine synthase